MSIVSSRHDFSCLPAWGVLGVLGAFMFAGMKSFALLSTEPCASAQVSFLRCALHSLYAWHGMPGSCRQMRGSPVCLPLCVFSMFLVLSTSSTVILPLCLPLLHMHTFMSLKLSHCVKAGHPALHWPVTLFYGDIKYCCDLCARMWLVCRYALASVSINHDCEVRV